MRTTRKSPRRQSRDPDDPTTSPFFIGWLILFIGIYQMIKGIVMFGTERGMRTPGEDSWTDGPYLEQPIFYGITGSMLFLTGTFLIGIYYITLTMRLREQNILHQKSAPMQLGQFFLIIGISMMYKGYIMFDTREWTVIADYFNLEQSLFFAITGSMIFLSGGLLIGMQYIMSAISKKK